MSEKLTDNSSYCVWCDFDEENCKMRKNCFERKMYEKLKMYEDLEEHGKLVLYPTYAYFIIDGNIHKGWVQEVVYSVCRKPLCDIRYDDNSLASYRGYVGNTVFLTKEEAEAALAKMKGE